MTVSTQKKLSIATPTDTQIVMTRSFDAPVELVWKAMTTPEFLRKWLFNPPGWTMSRCDEDIRVGGSYRWEWNGPDGKLAMAMHGTYREVVPLDHLTRTETFEMGCQPMDPAMCSLAFKRSGGTTIMTITCTYSTKQARDGALASGMETGMNIGYDQLDQMLAGGGIK